MTDIKYIPLKELLDDKAACEMDIIVCNMALTHGHKTYSNGKSTQERLDKNQYIVDVITTELKRRGYKE